MMTGALMNPGLLHSPQLAAIAAFIMAFIGTDSFGQERASGDVAGVYPYAGGAVLASPKSLGVMPTNRIANVPVLNPIAPDAPRQGSVVIPEHQTAINQMLQSHEFTIGGKKEGAGFAKTPGPTGTNLDLDAVKLRISRDKIMLRAQFSFN